MINKTLTSVLINDNSVDLFYRIDDTFIANSNIYFSCKLNTLNTILTETISSGTINLYKLYVRICDSVSGSTINNILFEKIFTLDNSNIQNSSIIINISDITNNISHDYLCENMSSDEISSLYKTYKIIFRLSSNTNILDSKNNLLSTDIIQNFNIVLNTAESGPYDVSFNEIDLVSPLIFSEQETKNIYKKYMTLLGRERLRCFFPKNISHQAPLLFFHHGNGQFTSAYDLYLATAASYGYVCFSFGGSPTPTIGEGINILNTIQHIFEQKARLDFGFSYTILNFNKINLGGHSRGGVSVQSADSLIKDKLNNSVITNYSMVDVDIKSLILFATAGSPLIKNNTYIEIGDSVSGTTYDPFLNKPIFHIKGTADGDSQDSNVISFLGYSYDIKRNFHDLLNISIDYYNHGAIASPPFTPDAFGMYRESLYSPAINPRFSNTEKTLIYNNQYVRIIELCSELIYFLSIHNFDSLKLKKINYSNINLIDKKILADKPSGIVKQYYQAYNDIKYIIDNYSGITLSFAGSTGFTYTNTITGTYGYAIDNGYLILPETTQFDSYVNTKRIPIAETVTACPIDIADNDDFNGIIHLYDRCLFLPIQSNINLGYTFGNGLTFSENDYLCLTGSLKIIYPRSTGNTLPCAFNMTLIDNSLNSSTVSSKTSGQYFEPPYQPYNNIIDGDGYFSTASPNYRNTIYFRAGDFYLQNSSLNLNNINQIMLSFGPDHGSTFCHIVLDEFIVLKEI